MKTQAAVVSEPGGAFVLRDVDLLGPQVDEVIVALEASGMCHADLAARPASCRFHCPRCLDTKGSAASWRPVPRSATWR